VSVSNFEVPPVLLQKMLSEATQLSTVLTSYSERSLLHSAELADLVRGGRVGAISRSLNFASEIEHRHFEIRPQFTAKAPLQRRR
jgi:hypothetical protein